MSYVLFRERDVPMIDRKPVFSRILTPVGYVSGDALSETEHHSISGCFAEALADFENRDDADSNSWEGYYAAEVLDWDDQVFGKWVEFEATNDGINVIHRGDAPYQQPEAIRVQALKAQAIRMTPGNQRKTIDCTNLKQMGV